MMQKPKRSYKTTFFVCLIAYSLSQLDLALFGYAIPAIRAEFGLTLFQMMLVVSSAFLIASVIVFKVSVVPDRVGRRKTLQFSFIVSSLIVAAQGLVGSVYSLAVLRGTSIATGGLTYPITATIVAEESPARYRGFLTGILQCGYAIGWFVASLFAASILEGAGWRYLFLVGLVSIPFLFVIRRYIHDSDRFVQAKSALGNKAQVKDLFVGPYRRIALTLFSAQFLFVWAYSGSVFLFPSFFVESRGLSQSEAAQVIGAGNAISVLGYLLAAWVGEFILTRRNTVVLWTLLGSLCFQLLIWGGQSVLVASLLFGLMGFFFYGTAAVKLAFVAEVFPTQLRSTGITICGTLAVTLGSASGPLAVSYFVEILGWNLSFSLLVGVPLTLAGLLYFNLRPFKSGLEVEEIQSQIALSAK